MEKGPKFEKAQKSLEELEDSVVKETSGKLLDMPAETHEEHEKREKRERKESERMREREKIKHEIEDLERRQASVNENAELYDKTYEEIREQDEELYRKLEEVFMPNVKRQVRLKSAGARINLPAVFRWEADKGAGIQAIDNRIFESVHLPDKKDYVFTLLVDLSGSMEGEKIQETFKGVVLLTEVLNRLGVKNEILGFQDEVIDFKDFDQELTDDIRRKITGMIAEVNNDNPGGHNNSSYNDDGPCLLDASESLDLQQGKEKFLVVLSDGLPEGRRSDKGDLTEAVEKITKTTDQKLIGIGLGSNTEHVKKFYPTALPNINTEKLAEVLGNLLEDLMINPQKYSYDKDQS